MSYSFVESKVDLVGTETQTIAIGNRGYLRFIGSTGMETILIEYENGRIKSTSTANSSQTITPYFCLTGVRDSFSILGESKTLTSPFVFTSFEDLATEINGLATVNQWSGTEIFLDYNNITKRFTLWSNTDFNVDVEGFEKMCDFFGFVSKDGVGINSRYVFKHPRGVGNIVQSYRPILENDMKQIYEIVSDDGVQTDTYSLYLNGLNSEITCDNNATIYHGI